MGRTRYPNSIRIGRAYFRLWIDRCFSTGAIVISLRVKEHATDFVITQKKLKERSAFSLYAEYAKKVRDFEEQAYVR